MLRSEGTRNTYSSLTVLVCVHARSRLAVPWAGMLMQINGRALCPIDCLRSAAKRLHRRGRLADGIQDLPLAFVQPDVVLLQYPLGAVAGADQRAGHGFPAALGHPPEIGSASSRATVCQHV